MCPLWPLHYLILVVLLFYSLCYMVNAAASSSTKLWDVKFDPLRVVGLKMSNNVNVSFSTTDYTETDVSYGVIKIVPDDDNIVNCNQCLFYMPSKLNENESWNSSFSLEGKFLGSSYVKLKLETTDQNGQTVVRESPPLSVTVIRNERLIDKLFTISVAVLVSVIFINFGCALDWNALKNSLKRPVGPAICFVSQFLFMPFISFILGKLLFPNSVSMQLGMFFTGISPGGGASNVWVYMLGGNINLSITMTAVSKFVAFFMIPLWTFTLGQQIFSSAAMTVPYSRIASFAVSLLVPLSIGFLLQRKCPRISQMMVRILKPFSGCLILFIIIFASLTNLYLFKLFTWRIAIAGFGLPFMGYVVGWLLAKAFKQSPKDVLAISVETGLQNTGIAIFMLRFSLGQPEADLTTVVPVAVAMMTPIPLTICYLYKKFRKQTEVETKLSNGSAVIPLDDKVVMQNILDERRIVRTISETD